MCDAKKSKPKVIIICEEVLSQESQQQIAESLGAKIDAEVIVGLGLHASCDVLAPYMLQEQMGDYTWKAGVQTFEQLGILIDERKEKEDNKTVLRLSRKTYDQFRSVPVEPQEARQCFGTTIQRPLLFGREVEIVDEENQND